MMRITILVAPEVFQEQGIILLVADGIIGVEGHDWVFPNKMTLLTA